MANDRKKKAFDGVYAQLGEVDGNVVLFDAKGAPSVIFQMINPVLRLCTDADQYRPDCRRRICPAEAGHILPSEISS